VNYTIACVSLHEQHKRGSIWLKTISDLVTELLKVSAVATLGPSTEQSSQRGSCCNSGNRDKEEQTGQSAYHGSGGHTSSYSMALTLMFDLPVSVFGDERGIQD
jgi:hypothetical protein